jgi:formylglycine-generating enzyme
MPWPLACLGLLGAIVAVLGFVPRVGARPCPADMVIVRDFCIDRFEASAVDRTTGEALSPYYPPHPRLVADVYRAWTLERPLVGSPAVRAMPLPRLSAFQEGGRYEAKAVSAKGAVPQAYVSQHLARDACARAGKRLCSLDEWKTACRGEGGTPFPYGERFERGACNVWGHVHPAFVLHGNSSAGHRDPRLNLLALEGRQPILRRTGSLRTCASRWGEDAIYDMVGNLDEWVAEESGIFVGGFYARGTSAGCESQITNHAPAYYDYSTGFRCCKGG